MASGVEEATWDIEVVWGTFLHCSLKYLLSSYFVLGTLLDTEQEGEQKYPFYVVTLLGSKGNYGLCLDLVNLETFVLLWELSQIKSIKYQGPGFGSLDRPNSRVSVPFSFARVSSRASDLVSPQEEKEAKEELWVAFLAGLK